MNGRLITIKELSNSYNVSSSTIRRLINSNKVKGQKVGGQWRFDPQEVKEAFDKGLLAGASSTSQVQTNYLKSLGKLEWTERIVGVWRESLNSCIESFQPDHIIVTDRRGAKVWTLVMQDRYIWGVNLWHTTGIRLMSFQEFQKTFANRRVLLFDEMTQFGREMSELRERFEKVNAEVENFVCVRRRSFMEDGSSIEYRVKVCEDLDDFEFSKRATDISELMMFIIPPLDVDHIVVKGKLSGEFNDALDLLQTLPNWGLTSVVRQPDKINKFFSITLDRPQFFNTENIPWLNAFQISWGGPCKIRFYINPEDKECYCSFIVFPEIKGPASSWTMVKEENAKLDKRLMLSEDKKFDKEIYGRTYFQICVDLAIKLLNDFIVSGAANAIGIRFEEIPFCVDHNQLRATFGPKMGNRIFSKITEILSSPRLQTELFERENPMPPSLFLRQAVTPTIHGYDTFDCRTDLLKAVPRRIVLSETNEIGTKPVSYYQLIQKLNAYSESTLGKILDYELDWGTIKPVIQVEPLPNEIKVWRGFFRGEYGPWFEWDQDVHTQEDRIVQRTLAIAPFVVHKFLKRTGEKSMTATNLAKVFSNLCQDWAPSNGKLYLGWRANKYGAVPIVPKVNDYGGYESFETFLIKTNCLKRVDEKHGTRIWRRYKVQDNPHPDWGVIYDKTIDGTTKYYLSGLIRLYAEIQKSCTTSRPAIPGSSQLYNYGDPLVVLASVRNERTAYRCGWFEVADWKQKGALLFPVLENLALQKTGLQNTFLHASLEDFASPARLLFDKIEMYKTLPDLRKQIIKLMDEQDLEAANAVLATVDEEPLIRTESPYPIKFLEWACGVMRPFSSFVRQIMTMFNLDKELSRKRKMSETGEKKDATFYLNRLLQNCEELRVMRSQLQNCINDSREGILTSEIANTLHRAFKMIVKAFELKILDPRKVYEIRNEHRNRIDGLQVRLREIRKPEPYVIAILDIYNFKYLLSINELFGVTYEAAMEGLEKWIDDVSERLVEMRTSLIYGGLTNDNLIFASSNPDDMLDAIMELEKIVSEKLFKIDSRFDQKGIFRTGCAWHDRTMGQEYSGVRPGLLAHTIGDRHGRSPGSIALTQEVFEHLGSDLKKGFRKEEVNNKVIFIRNYYENQT